MSPERIDLNGATVRAARLLSRGGEDTTHALVERARELGRSEGSAAARDETVARLEQALCACEAERLAACGGLARVSVELAITIAREILRREISAGNFDLEKIVRETLSEASIGRGSCVVHVHPADRETLKEVRFRTGTTVLADEGVRRGDVHVETSLGTLVRETSRLLEAVRQRLLEELH